MQLKIARVLSAILSAFLIIALRVWHLGVMQREESLGFAQKPQQRNVVLRAERGRILDRFHIPLAINKIQYNAAIYYGQIAQIPAVKWGEDSEGKKVRIYARREYIRELAKVLEKNLQLDAERIEDLIYSKAALFPHAPFLLKAGISEKEHYHLKALEKDWLGIHAEIASTRHYPMGKTASHLIGMMGAISAEEYGAVAKEMKELQESVDLYEQGLQTTLPKGISSFEEVYERLYQLKEKAYSLNDLVGKSGIEGQFEETLRGFFGKKTFEIDQKGRICKELPGGRTPIPGQEILLSISIELQQFAEELLIEEEKRREEIARKKGLKTPEIKGAAIVVLDPYTGEILALASHPNFDPNDFIPGANFISNRLKQRQIEHWLESNRWIGALWDGKETLEGKSLTWEAYLLSIAPEESPLHTFFQKVDDIKSAIQVQEDFEALCYFSQEKDPLALLKNLSSIPPSATPYLRRLEPLFRPIPSPEDRLFAIDLCRMVVDASRFSDTLIEKVGSMKLSSYRTLCQEFQRLEETLRGATQEKFRKKEFQEWKKEHQKEFLAQKRTEEKEKKTYARPYLDYLDQKEKELFELHWQEKRLPILLEALPKYSADLLQTFRSYQQLNRPLLGHYRLLRNQKGEQTEKDLAAAFYPIGGFGFLRSFAFQATAPLGSLFKLVTAYEGLRQGISSFSLIDEWGFDPKAPPGKQQIVSYSLNRTPYPRIYKGGRLPRTSSSRVGKIDIVGAIEQSSNPFFSLLAGDFFKDPEDLMHAARTFGFGEKSGIELPGETKGNLPSDLKTNRTGLYSFAIGQHTLLSTPLQGALFVATLANGGKLLKPKITLSAKGLSPKRNPMDSFCPENPFAKRELEAIGIHFPLFTKASHPPYDCNINESSTEVKRTIPFPPSIHTPLLEGMDHALWGARGNARPTVIRSLVGKPDLLRDFLALKHQMIGKTSTAELLYNPYVYPSSQAKIYKHVWFGAISSNPPLVILTFSRYGDAGKEGAPIAARIIHKWRNILRQKSECRSQK